MKYSTLTHEPFSANVPLQSLMSYVTMLSQQNTDNVFKNIAAVSKYLLLLMVQLYIQSW